MIRISREVYFVLLLSQVILFNNVNGQDYIDVTLDNGIVRGTFNYSRNKVKFASFTKIPYAKPPIGDLRFKAPVPADAWKGILDATQDVPKCIQKDYVSYSNPKIEGVEDCLYINVFAPEIALQHKKLLPVMVSIHWGGNFAGSSRPEVMGPKYLMDKEVLMVSFNYRLGIFGYFSTLNDDSPGNYGNKDQVLALKWVQANIEKFGGDPNQVTIFGQSAGAGAVHHLMLSPSSKGLFHRAISQSGSALCIYAAPLNLLQEQIYRFTGNILGCPSEDTTALVECMRKLDAERVMNAQDVFKYFDRDPLIVYTHVIETKTERNPEPFLEKQPAEIIKSGKFNKVPWIVGTVQDEGALKTAPLMLNSKTRELLLQQWNTVMPKLALIDLSLPNDTVSTFWAKMKDFYLQSDIVNVEDPDSVKKLTNMFSDRWFKYCTYQSALAHAMNGHNDIYFYNFNYKGTISHANTVFVKDADAQSDYDLGVSHCDDLIYIHNSPELFSGYELNDEELNMSRVMVTFWTNFAKTGIPHHDWAHLPDIEGKAASNSDLYYLDIQGPRNLVLRNNYRTKAMNWWATAPIAENVWDMI